MLNWTFEYLDGIGVRCALLSPDNGDALALGDP